MLQEFHHYSSSFFSLNFKQSRKATALTMQIFGNIVNTKDIPGTKKFLLKNHPSVLQTKCFNDKNLPFFEEVNQTEIGHLFEHILLDQLCILKIKSGAPVAVFNGNTSWNWRKYPVGSFQILIDIGKKELRLLLEALSKTIQLTENLIQPKVQMLLSQKTTGNLYGGYPQF